MADDDEITVIPQIMLLEQVLSEIGSGRLRIPRFQRPFVWRPEQMLNLFDSIERGYPIGSLLVWETNLRVPSLDQVADIDIPGIPSDGTAAYLLDGHQRLSTLFGSLLKRPITGNPEAQKEWMWQVYRVLRYREEKTERFRHWKRAEPPPPNYLPMRSVLRTMDFLAYSRRLSDAVESESLELLLDEAEALAHRIKSYQVAVVRLKGGDLGHAVEVFSRLNSSGQSMSPDQMVSALAYRAEGDSLAERIDAIREGLGPLGFGQVTSMTVFRSILAVTGEVDVLDARWDVLANRVRGQLAEAVKETDQAMHRAVAFLREYVPVPMARLVPYQVQILLLTAFFHNNPEPSERMVRELVRWFWGTSWSGFFAGANSTQVKNALQQMKSFSLGIDKLPWEPQTARPFPNRFDMRSARVRAFILWELREFNSRLTESGESFDPVKALSASDSNAYQHVLFKTPKASHPANRLIFPTGEGFSVRRALLNIPQDLLPNVTESHGIPSEAMNYLFDGDGEGFITERAHFLEMKERSFMETMGIEASSDYSGEADIDTE
ncbi:DUF262 domain-containing protein [Streptomyces sp. NPDC056909]|uniref:DUF262 domain-containing protein n=1 Tax=Streptomyces sp. NPDC056909 TaxID=3345963 RepID=UPI00369AF72E